MTSNLCEEDKALVLKFIELPNEKFISAQKVSEVSLQDGTTERWKYYLSEKLFVIVDGYIPGPWLTTTKDTFHRAILQEVHQE